ncbi:hypothetical protein MUP77_19805 [Candidatus Bathyarchaeota archaeon]|nr:hypothetical protein [Candidatus Bathyarchaeota archaeon]
MKKNNPNMLIERYRQKIVAILIVAGVLLFVFSYYQSNLLTSLIGLGLVIWGSSLLFVTSTKMIRADLITSQLSSLTLALDRTLKATGYDGDTYVLPPRLPGEQPVQVIESRLTKSRTSIVPTGLHLESLFEEMAGVDFLSLDLFALEDLLVKVIVENLEIASDFKLLKEEEKIIIKMNDFVFFDFYNYMRPIAANKDRVIFSCPTVSALACAFAKSTQKAVLVENVMLAKKSIEIRFRLFDRLVQRDETE